MIENVQCLYTQGHHLLLLWKHYEVNMNATKYGAFFPTYHDHNWQKKQLKLTESTRYDNKSKFVSFTKVVLASSHSSRIFCKLLQFHCKINHMKPLHIQSQFVRKPTANWITFVYRNHQKACLCLLHTKERKEQKWKEIRKDPMFVLVLASFCRSRNICVWMEQLQLPDLERN